MKPKVITLSQIVEDLNNGLTRWKKDDIGFGSLEKKYNLTMPEMIQLFAHPKIKNIETTIPVFIIEDDIKDEPILNEDISQPSSPPEREAKIEVVPRQTTIIVKKEEVVKEEIYESFI